MNDKSTKLKLLDVAKELFASRGYHSVSTRELAEQAGVNLGSITYHFESKQNLFVAALLSLLEEENQEMWEFSGTNEQALSQFVYLFLKTILDEDSSQGCRLVHREALDETATDLELKAMIVDAVVEHHISPKFSKLKELLKKMKPSLSDSKCSLHALSVVGQCTFYFTDKAFIEKLLGWDLGCEKKQKEVASHIASNISKAL